MNAQMVSRYALPMRLRADARGRAVPAPTASLSAKQDFGPGASSARSADVRDGVSQGMGAQGNGKPILEVRDLCREFTQSQGAFKKDTVLRAVSHVSFDMYEGEILSLLGESGCGKTTLARMLMHLIRPTSGKILLDGAEIQDLSQRQFRAMRRNIQMVYQNPFDCLDPSRRVGSLLEEPLALWHSELSKEQRRERIEGILAECGLDPACLQKRPSEFSGGQLQRLSIARALLVRPRLLIADEIVSALDVPIQNQILQLLSSMKTEHNFTILFITHDLSVARKVSDRVMIMRQGELAGIGPTHETLDCSDDPYIQKLAASVFTFDGAVA